jgi:ParB family transcriptional regulator, chromosome partitioning protein
MPAQKRGLGRGLGALIPTGPPAETASTGVADRPAPPSAAQGSQATDPVPVGGVPAQAVTADGLDAYFDELPVGALTPNPRQPRQVFDEEALDELADSIRIVGLLQPVVVRAIMPGHYEIIMGERRWRAVQKAGLTHVPAIVRRTQDDALLRDALIENLHREQLNPLEEAAAYQQLLDDFGATHEELARRIGRSRPHISNTLRLLQLPPDVQRRVAAGVLSAGHARALLGVGDPAAQEALARRIVAEGLSVRAVEEIVALGVQPEKAQRRNASRAPAAPALQRLADRLSDVFDTRVKVELGRRKGKIVVEFASMEDLERIVGTMSPEDPQRSGA